MGIPGLLKSLASITKRVHIDSYAGLTVGIDALCWLHQGKFCCIDDLVEGHYTNKFITYCLERLQLLISRDIKPVLVFDGRSLPCKNTTNLKRRDERLLNRSLGNEARFNGNEALARNYFKRSVGVTTDMINQFVDVLRAEKIDFLISPYESDAQLAFLSRSKAIDVVITEDSDVLVYGCRRVLFKMDREGYGDEILRENLGSNEGLSFSNWTEDQFKMFCCLAGCDYAPKVKNLGIKTAHQYASKYKTFAKLATALSASSFQGITDSYLLQLENAVYTFKHQVLSHSTRMKRLI